MLENKPINYVIGQRWIEIQGTYTSSQLREIANEIDRNYNKAFKDGNNKRRVNKLEIKSKNNND